MNWLVPYDRLDNKQRGILQRFQAQPKKSLWITGFAGSGKSVLLIHLLITIKELFPAKRVAVVGFTHALLDQLRSGIPFHLKSSVPVMTPQQFAKSYDRWDYVLVDEVQDLKHDFFTDPSERGSTVIAAGDMNQSIHEDTCPEYDIIDYLDLDIRRLNIIHRLLREMPKETSIALCLVGMMFGIQEFSAMFSDAAEYPAKPPGIKQESKSGAPVQPEIFDDLRPTTEAVVKPRRKTRLKN